MFEAIDPTNIMIALNHLGYLIKTKLYLDFWIN